MNSTDVTIILASQSPRRAELLANAGYQFIVVEPDPEAEEQAQKNYPPEQLVVELAKCKAQNVVSKLAPVSGLHQSSLWQSQGTPPRKVSNSESAQMIVLAADTVALCEGVVLGKPVDQADAFRMLRHMSGREHQVLTGVCLWNVASNRSLERLSVTTLRMDELSDHQLKVFLRSGDWQGKAGGFGYQDGLEWLHIVGGLESNVVGLPVECLRDWIEELNLV